MQEEKKLTEQESLALITAMINKAKNSYIESGIGPLSWGVLITFCSLFSYFEIIMQWNIAFDIWLLSLFALVPQIYYSWRSKRQRGFTAHEEIIMDYVWSTFAICMFLLSFYNNRVHPTHSTALTMMLFGIPTFITGGIRNFKPMVIGGIVCWICCLVSLYVTISDRLLLMAISAISAWLVPGIILRRKYLKLKHV